MIYELFSALALGFLVAINPCQLAINVSALTYILRKDMGMGYSPYPSLMYVFGRSLTYVVLACVMVCLLGGGKNIDTVQTLLSQSEMVVPYVLIAFGVFFLYRGIHRHRHEHGDDCHNCGQLIRRNGPMGSLILGMTLAFAFCPESAVLYFGVMLPLSVSSAASLLIPVFFAIGAALPVMALSLLMGKAADGAMHLSGKFEKVQQCINILTGIAFMAVGVWLTFNS